MRDIPLLVPSCDRYADLWGPFFRVFRHRWPDCPLPVYLGSNHRTCAEPGVTTIATGDDLGWGQGLGVLLARLRAKHVLVFLEDFFLEEAVDTENILRLVRVAVENGVGCLRMAPNPPPSRPVQGHPELGWLMPGDPYRVSTQVALWKTETLAFLARPEFTAWDFELKGSLLSAEISEPFWSVWNPAVRCRHGVQKGVWLPWGLAACRAAGIDVDLTTRRAMTEREIWQWKLGKLRGEVFWSLPPPFRRKRWVRIASGR